ncbi:MAG: hypothetical protein AB8G11_08350 [Saprospiraceae bacterium]
MILLKKSDEEHLEFLSKILSAVQYQITKDVVLITIEQETKTSLTNMMKNINISTIVLFDITPKDISLNYNLPKYFPLKINEKTLLLVDSLNQISKNKIKKKELWTALQKVFL